MRTFVDEVHRSWPFSKENYPDYPQDRDSRIIFEITHCLMHVSKSHGQCMGILEPLQHGERLANSKRDELQKESIKLVIDTVRMALSAGVSANDLMHDVVLRTARQKY